jgi:hypothetical protein
MCNPLLAQNHPFSTWPHVFPLCNCVLYFATSLACCQWPPIDTLDNTKVLRQFFITWVVPGICPIPMPCVALSSLLFFYCEDLLVPSLTPKLEAHPLSTLHDCLFNISAATLHIWGSFIPSAFSEGVMLCWQVTHRTWLHKANTQWSYTEPMSGYTLLLY